MNISIGFTRLTISFRRSSLNWKNLACMAWTFACLKGKGFNCNWVACQKKLHPLGTQWYLTTGWKGATGNVVEAWGAPEYLEAPVKGSWYWDDGSLTAGVGLGTILFKWVWILVFLDIYLTSLVLFSLSCAMARTSVAQGVRSLYLTILLSVRYHLAMPWIINWVKH